MGRTVIKIAAIINAKKQIDSAKAFASSAKTSFVQTKNSIDSKIQNRANIRNRLSTVSQQLNGIDNKISKISSTVQSSANQYKNTDDRIGSWGRYAKNNIDVFGNSLSACAGSKSQIHIPSYVTNRSRIVGVDFTGIFLGVRSSGLDAFASAWNSDFIDNFLAQFGIGEDLNEKAVKRSLKLLIKNTLKQKHTNSEYLKEYTTMISPDELKIYNEVFSLITDSAERANEINIDEILASSGELSDSEWLKWMQYDGNLDLLKKFSNNLDIGAYLKGVEYSDKVFELIGMAFNDYSEDLQYLEAIRVALYNSDYDNAVVNDVVNSMIRQYQNQLSATLAEGLETFVKESTGYSVEKALPLLQPFLSAKKLGCLASNLDGVVENIENVYATQHFSYALVDQYNSYADKIRSGDYTPLDVEQCELYFNLARNAKIQECESMISIYQEGLDSTEINIFSGAADVVVALSTSDEEKDAVRYMIDSLENEIIRLEGLDSEKNSEMVNIGASIPSAWKE